MQTKLPAVICKVWCNAARGTCSHSLAYWHILRAILHLPLRTNTHIHRERHTHRVTPGPVKYAAPWLLLSFLISYVIEWGLLSGLLHGSDYFPGHPWSSSAWLNVMDGEEMVMSETVPSPARPKPLNNYSRIVWLNLNKSGDSLKMGSLTLLQPWSIDLDLVANNSVDFVRTCDRWGLDLSEHSFVLSIPSFICKAPLDPLVKLLE